MGLNCGWRTILQKQHKLMIRRLIKASHLLAIGAVLLCAPLVNSAHADSVMGNHVMPAALEPAARRATADPQSEAAATSEFTQLLQDLSPLPVLALGLLGLIWIRRHTTDL